MVRAGGSASRIIGDCGATEPGGGKRAQDTRRLGNNRWGSPWISFPALGSHSSTNAGRRERPVSDNEGDVAGGGTARLPVSSPRWAIRRGVCGLQVPGGSLPPKPVVDLSDVRENALGRPLSVGAPEFSPALDPRTRGTIASVALSNAAGTMAPVDFAGLSVPVVAGVQFSAVAEVHSSAVLLADRHWTCHH